MSKTSLFVGSIVCCLLFTTQASASTPESTAISGKPTWSFLLGTNASNIRSNQVSNEFWRMKVGGTFGLEYSSRFNNQLNPNWIADFAIVLQQKGFSIWEPLASISPPDGPKEKVRTVHTNYVSARQLLKRYLNQQWSVTAGIEEGFLIDERVVFVDNGETIVTDFQTINDVGLGRNRLDFAFICGAEYRLRLLPITLRIISGIGVFSPYRQVAFWSPAQGIVFEDVKWHNTFINFSVGHIFCSRY